MGPYLGYASAVYRLLQETGAWSSQIQAVLVRVLQEARRLKGQFFGQRGRPRRSP